jgi:phosphoserine phosphatase RsbU/P
MIAGPDVPGWEIASDYEPARQIGGDFFDVFPLLDTPAGERLGIVIADVAGKGISAALLMAFVRPVLRTALDRSGDPVAALERTNWILTVERRIGLFVTVFAGVLDTRTGRLRFASAGHEPPLLVPGADGPPRQLAVRGPLLGAFPRLGLREERVRLRVGDSLILYTDGVTDATAPDGERFGDERLLQLAGDADGGTASAAERCARVVGAVRAFQVEGEPADDIALLVLRRVRRRTVGRRTVRPRAGRRPAARPARSGRGPAGYG